MMINEAILKRIVYGAAFLGSGGGGSIKAGLEFVEEIVKSNKEIDIITFPLSEDDKKKFSCIVCDIGSISCFDSKQSTALQIAFEALKNHFTNFRIQALFPIETGPENTLAPFVLAARSEEKLAIVDGDGAGRAIPTLPLCTFAAEGTLKNWYPVAIANGEGDVLLVKSHEFDKFDSLLRPIAHIEQFSNSASLALWPDTIEELSKKCISGTVTKALHCGQLLEGIRNDDIGLINESLNYVNELQGFLIGMGTVIYKRGTESGAFNFTTTKIKNQLDDSTITVMSQNESLIAFSDNSANPIAIAPDSICYLRSDFVPCTNAEIEDTKYGDPEKLVKIFLIGKVSDEALNSYKIIDGFRKIISELGYAGTMKIKHPDAKLLGDLFLELRKSYGISKS